MQARGFGFEPRWLHFDVDYHIKITPHTEENMSDTLSNLVRELREDPEKAKEFFNTLRQTVGPWESVGSANAAVVSGFTRTTIFGESVAVITVGHPKWSISVEGETPKGITPVFHRSTSEVEAKEIVDNLLKEKGYIVLD